MRDRLKLAFGGDRIIAVRVLEWLIKQGDYPELLVLPEGPGVTHRDALREICSGRGGTPVVVRDVDLHTPSVLELFRHLELDFLLCVHLRRLIQPSLLRTLRAGALNLHPSYLPFNRGWHTPTWTILEGSPAGATLHYVDEHLDSGDIVYQEEEPVWPSDTADTLYTRLIDREFRVFCEGWRRIKTGTARRLMQQGSGTIHRIADLFCESVQRLDLAQTTTTEALLRRLRALTTSRIEEAAYFDADGRRYRIQVRITPVGSTEVP